MARVRRYRRKSNKRHCDRRKQISPEIDPRSICMENRSRQSQAKKSEVIPKPSSVSNAHANTYGNVVAAGSAKVIMGNLEYNRIFFVDKASNRYRSNERLIRDSSSLQDTSSLSSFESLPSFRPDRYTDRSAEMTLYNYSGHEIVRSATSQTHLLTLLYRPESQIIIQITLSLTLNSSSKYWGFITSDELFTNSSFNLFQQFLPQLSKWLHAKWPKRKHLQLQGCLNDDFVFKESEKNRNPAIERQVQMRSALFNLFSAVQHWQCPWYYEEELSRRQLFKFSRASSFLVYIPQERQWACETRFVADKLKFERQYHSLRVLHCMRIGRCPDVVRFYGVVRDTSDCVVAFLSELPTNGRIHRAMRQAHRTGRSVSRLCRERWCMQIVRAVAEIHRRTLIVGMLCQRMDGIVGLNDNNDAVLLPYFRQTIFEDDRCLYCGTIPPELRGVELPIQATPESDLFQLGLVLWRIAGNKLSEDRTEFCLSYGCQTPVDVICHDPHTDPIALPMTEYEFTAEMRRIINICRSENPRQRLPAQDLLMMFSKPSPVTLKRDRIQDSLIPNIGPEEYLERWSSSCGCDNCGRDCSDHHFHCTICQSNDFDLCEYCVATGCHCFNEQHRLIEFRTGFEQSRILSNVKRSGHREVTVMSLST